MKLIDAFEAEHRLIDQVLGAFRTYVDRRVDGAAGAVEVADGARFVAFFAGRLPDRLSALPFAMGQP